jgi:hypothetical protein
MLTLFLNFPSGFFRRRLISVFVVLSMFTMILIDSYYVVKCKKENPSFDNIYSGSLCEKIHLKFCNFILGVPKRTTNIAVLSELGTPNIATI